MRLIDADDFREDLCRKLHFNYIATKGGQEDEGVGEFLADCIELLDERPTIDAEPVVHAHWINVSKEAYDPRDRNQIFDCSKCRRSIRFVPYGKYRVPSDEYPYCHCGAKMDEEMK